MTMIDLNTKDGFNYGNKNDFDDILKKYQTTNPLSIFELSELDFKTTKFFIKNKIELNKLNFLIYTSFVDFKYHIGSINNYHIDSASYIVPCNKQNMNLIINFINKNDKNKKLFSTDSFNIRILINYLFGKSEDENFDNFPYFSLEYYKHLIEIGYSMENINLFEIMDKIEEMYNVLEFDVNSDEKFYIDRYINGFTDSLFFEVSHYRDSNYKVNNESTHEIIDTIDFIYKYNQFFKNENDFDYKLDAMKTAFKEYGKEFENSELLELNEWGYNKSIFLSPNYVLKDSIINKMKMIDNLNNQKSSLFPKIRSLFN